MQTPEYDVAVVGAGPAGASAAISASRLGARVLLMDYKKSPGLPVQCAEYVPLSVRQYTDLPPGAVVQKINTLLTYINNEPVSTLSGPGYILDRGIFDRSLVEAAVAAGAEFMAGAKAAARSEDAITVSRTGKGSRSIKCKVIIGADGPRSTVGRWMGSVNRDFMIALQYKLPLRRQQTSTDVYFSPEYIGGYGWVFPKGAYANVGVGVSFSYKDRLQECVQSFVNRLIRRGILSDGHPLMKTSGLIPVGGPLPVTKRENMLLAGDAAGHTHPVTGGGIMNAVVTGRMAGETAARAALSGQLEYLSQYPPQWQSQLGRFLHKAVQQRHDMDQHWTEDAPQFEALIKRTWIGCD
ncbi:MAG TPA: geranylgeranyl reductase family protein [Syntrophomonas sp.]|nr:geranylgeranyl reductase family protein [Syntrophomonas sp.]